MFDAVVFCLKFSQTFNSHSVTNNIYKFRRLILVVYNLSASFLPLFRSPCLSSSTLALALAWPCARPRSSSPSPALTLALTCAHPRPHLRTRRRCPASPPCLRLALTCARPRCRCPASSPPPTTPPPTSPAPPLEQPPRTPSTASCCAEAMSFSSSSFTDWQIQCWSGGIEIGDFFILPARFTRSFLQVHLIKVQTFIANVTTTLLLPSI